MKMLRDIIVTVAVLLGLIAGLVALPIAIALILVVIVGFCTYAVVHDRRIDKELREKENT